MSRTTCVNCHKPTASCYCEFICSVDNPIELIIWQHPSEANHPKGSAPFLAACLNSVQTLEAESCTQTEFNHRFGTNKLRNLLSPVDSQNSTAHVQSSASNESPAVAPQQLLIIDGTWRKSRKIYYLNPWLQNIPTLQLSTSAQSQYKIRKAEKPGQYSTLEAACFGLAQLESNSSRYLVIQHAFNDYTDHISHFYPHLKQ